MTNQTSKEIFAKHVAALVERNIERLLELRKDDSVLITAEKTYRGKDEIGEFYRKLLAELPEAEWGLTAESYHDDVLYIEWTCKSGRHNVADGVDTFIFRDGVIAAQTARCTLVLAKLNA